jgi:hypothetical protein
MGKATGIGKTKHWNEGRRIKNATRRLKKRIKSQTPENQEKALDNIKIQRDREGRTKTNEKR